MISKTKSIPIRILAAHMVAYVLIQSVWFGVSSMMAVLAIRRFNAGNWDTVLITAAGPTLLITALFWGELLRKVSIRRYLMIQWLCMATPLLCGALSQQFWHLFICNAIAATAAAGWSPVAGDILKRLYNDRVRGRAFGLVTSAMLIGMTLFTYLVGKALDHYQDVFRFYMPVAAVLYGVGVIILCRLVPQEREETRQDTVSGTQAARLPQISFRRFLEPVLHMRQILRADRTFYRYEAAFMTYGIGWMVCYALLPVLATDRLQMSYSEFAQSTQMVYSLCMLAMTYPMGWVMDRIGATRTSGLAFALLALYPLGLWYAPSVTWVGIATVIYGMSMAGVNVGWMLGPVSLAPSGDKVSQYVAIHATLVGLRGIVFQWIGMAIYRLTGSFAWPFVVAALAFAWATWQMWQLHGWMRVTQNNRITSSSMGNRAQVQPVASLEKAECGGS